MKFLITILVADVATVFIDNALMHSVHTLRVCRYPVQVDR